MSVQDDIGPQSRMQDLIVAEVEAHYRMADPTNPPVYEEQVGRPQLGELEHAVAPAIGVLCLGTIVAIAYVVQRNAVPGSLCPCSASDVRTPFAAV